MSTIETLIGRLTGNLAAERLAQVVRSHVLLQQVEPEGFALDGILLLAQKLKDDEGSGSTLQNRRKIKNLDDIRRRFLNLRKSPNGGAPLGGYGTCPSE